MEPQNETPAPIPERRSVGTPFSIRHLLPGLAIGILLGIIGLLTYQNHLPGLTKVLYTVTLISFGIVVLTFLMVFVFRQFITRKILGENSVGDFLNDAQAVADTVTDQLAKNALVNLPPATSERVRKVLPRLANWFIWGRLRNWWWNWILGVFVSLGGLTGTILLMNQNELLKAQNEKIDRQMQLEEATRRSALVVLMSNILDKVDREIESQQKGLSIKAKEQKKYTISQSLIGQIAALSHSFKPYQYMDTDTLIGKPLSPERGQLLITLTLLPLDTNTFRKIYRSATFESAGLRDAILDMAYLKGANLRRADLRGAYLIGADLRGAYLARADLRDTEFIGADLIGTEFERAELDRADFRGADLRAADLSMANLRRAYLAEVCLSGANLSGANLSGANLREANLTEANLTEANLNGTNLKEADLSRADLSEVDLTETKKLTIAQLSKTSTLYGVKNLNDSLSIALQKQYPGLFEYVNRDSTKVID